MQSPAGNPSITSWVLASVLCAASVMAPVSLHAEMLAYEGFDYAAGDQSQLASETLDGGIGWQGPWQNLTRMPTYISPITEGSLGYVDAAGHILQTSGNHVVLSGVSAQQAGNLNGLGTQVKRVLAQPASTQPGDTVYVSFIGQRIGEPADPGDAVWSHSANYPAGYPFGDNLYPRGAGIELFPDGQARTATAYIGALSNRPFNAWSFNAESTHINDMLPFTEPAFVVVRFDYTAHQQPNLIGELIQRTGTRVRVWINPQRIDLEDPADAHQQTVLLDEVDPFQIGIGALALITHDHSHNRPVSALRVDEIRMGTSWTSVTPYVGQAPDRTDPRDPSLPLEWAGLPVSDKGQVDAGPKLGVLWVAHAPWVFCYPLNTWIYLPEQNILDGDAWLHVTDSDASRF